MTSMRDDEIVLVAVKTPMMRCATTALLPGRLTLIQSLEEIRKVPPKNTDATRVLQQLQREMSGGAYDFLVVTPTGEIVKALSSTTLEEITVPREIRTSRGLEKIPTAAFEIQAYARVGQ